jgi:hypothetical protein
MAVSSNGLIDKMPRVNWARLDRKEIVMGLRTERGGDHLPDWLLAAAEGLVGRLEASQCSQLYRLVSNARQGIMGSAREWQPFKSLLRNSRIVHSDRNHVTAVMLALLPQVVKQEKFARFAAARDARERMRKMDGRSGKFVVSSASSSSIEKGAERFPLALDRLAKK